MMGNGDPGTVNPMINPSERNTEDSQRSQNVHGGVLSLSSAAPLSEDSIASSLSTYEARFRKHQLQQQQRQASRAISSAKALPPSFTEGLLLDPSSSPGTSSQQIPIPSSRQASVNSVSMASRPTNLESLRDVMSLSCSENNSLWRGRSVALFRPSTISVSPSAANSSIGMNVHNSITTSMSRGFNFGFGQRPPNKASKSVYTSNSLLGCETR
jgi:hypothetical protein